MTFHQTPPFLRRGVLGALIVLAAACVLTASEAHAVIDRFHWFGPVALGPGSGAATPYTSGPLRAVTCPSPHHCTAVGSGGWEVTFNPVKPRSAHGKKIDGETLLSVWCPARTECVATDRAGGEVTFNPDSRPVRARRTQLASGALVGVRCRGSTSCTAVDRKGSRFTFDPSHPRAAGKAVSGGGLTALACPTKTQCTAVDNVGDAITFNVSGPPHPHRAVVDAGRALTAVACASAQQCTAVDADGFMVTFRPGSGSVIARPSPLSHGVPLSGVSCPSDGQCTAGDGDGQVILFNPGLPGYQVIRPLREASALTGVFCASMGECLAVDQVGHGFVGLTPPTPTSRPFITGTPVRGNTLTEHHAPWTGAPSRFTYVWTRCARDGSNCAAIRGATHRTYRLTGADVGHRLRVLETAYNKVSRSVPNNSFPTKVITG